jgi:type IV pilus assembly protein PilW
MKWSTSEKNKGLTLIELLIALVLSSVLIVSLYRIFIGQQKTYTVQDQVADMQQNIRGAIDRMTKEIRMAGYDPQSTGNFGFQIATSNGRITGSNSIAFTIDYNEDGIINNDDSEQIGFRLNGLKLQKYSTGAIHWQPVADNIESLSFLYTLADGTVTDSPADPKNIRVIKVTITAKTNMTDPEYKGGDGYRRRTLSSSIKARNMGL